MPGLHGYPVSGICPVSFCPLADRVLPEKWEGRDASFFPGASLFPAMSKAPAQAPYRKRRSSFFFSFCFRPEKQSWPKSSASLFSFLMNHPRHRENPWTLTKKNPRSIVSAPFYPNLPGKNPAEHRPLPSRRGSISPTCWTFLLKIQIRKKFEALAPAGGPDFHQNPMQQPRIPSPFQATSSFSNTRWISAF